MRFVVGPIDEGAAWEVAGWVYGGAYAAYNCPAGEADDFVGGILEPGNHYYAVRHGMGALVGYCCFGPDARVPGGEYTEVAEPGERAGDLDDGFLDVGLGLRPDLTGRGLGGAFLEAIAGFAAGQLGHRRLRVTVAAWNRRAIRLYEKAGFRASHVFTRETPGGVANGSAEWVQMVRTGFD
ncbi:MAG TPA: GNAT family protein [Chloroflexota bacterium]|nr:GNAT family protein [Chloroflexota bacterium]